jgi:ribonuclease BN (tRNA processing enzyme)
VSVSLTFLGTGNAFADGGRSHACILVTAPEGRILLDCGGSSLPAIRRACDPETIDAVAISHLHGDHFGGLVFLAMEAKYAPRRKPLVVGGPPSLERRFKDASVALFDDFYRDLPFRLDFTVLGREPARLGPAEVAALPVEHVPDSEPHGLRVRVGGKLIAYSGDARWSDHLPAVADGADLFICETTYYSDPDPVHLSAMELAAHRGELRCGRIVVTHLGKDAIANLPALGFEPADDGMTIRL